MIIHKLKIRTRLNLGAVLLLIFSVFISIIAILQMRNSGLHTTLIYEQPFLVGKRIGELNNRIYRIHNLGDNLLLVHSPTIVDSVSMQMDCMHKRNIELFDTLLFKLREEITVIDDIYNSYLKWYDSELNVIKWAKSDIHTKEEIRLTEICEEKLGDLVHKTNHITEIIQKSAFDYYTQSQNAEKKSTLIFTIVIFSLLGLALVLAFIVTQSISIPLKSVTNSLKQILKKESVDDKYSKMNELELIENSTQELKSAFKNLQEEISKRKLAEEKIEEQYNEIEEKNSELSTFNDSLQQQVLDRTHELSESETRYRLLFEKAVDGIVFMNAAGEFVSINDSYANMHGYTKEELLAKNINEINTADGATKHPERMKRILAGESMQFEIDHYHKDGHIINIDVTASPIKLQGEDFIFSFHKDISNRKKNQEILRESEERYRTLFENAIEGIFFVSLTGQLISVNESFAHMHGYSRNEMLQMNLNDIDTPESVEGSPDRFKRILAGESIRFEVQHFHKNGSIITLDVSASLIQANNENYVVGFHRDITEQKEISEGLQKLKQAVETSNEVVFMTDRKGLFTYVNPQFTKLYGYSSEDVLCKFTPRILKGGKLNDIAYEKFWSDLLSDKSINREILNKTKYGDLISIETSVNAIYSADNKLIGFLAIQRDISERKKVQEELIRAKEKAEESDRLKSSFLANMSHEIRTPLNGIVGFSEMLARPNITDEKKTNYLNIIKECSDQLMTIINDLIDIAKIEANQLTMTVCDVNIDSFLGELFKVCQLKVVLPEVQLDYLPDVKCRNPFILTDGNRLRQIITNLVDNAIKFTSVGHVKFGYKIKNHFVEFFVEDTGIGIEKEKHEMIFEPFKQADSGLSRNYGGTGLGLAISKALVKLLGGNMWLVSEVGIGTTFYFNIPLVLAHQPDKENEKNIISEYLYFNGKTVLVAEDETLSFQFLDEVLSDMGIISIHAQNGQEAVQIALENENINLILMDIKMPVITGYQAIEEIKKQRPNLPIIVQTAYAQDGDRELAIAAGCDEYISKPINVEKLNILIGKFLKD